MIQSLILFFFLGIGITMYVEGYCQTIHLDIDCVSIVLSNRRFNYRQRKRDGQKDEGDKYWEIELQSKGKYKMSLSNVVLYAKEYESTTGAIYPVSP